MPPKKGSTKAKTQDLGEMKRCSEDMPQFSVCPRPIRSRYLRIYNNYNAAMKGDTYGTTMKEKKAYLHKIGALRFNRMTDFTFAAEDPIYGHWGKEKNHVLLKGLKQIKRLRKIIIKIPTRSPLQRIKILKRVTSHLPHWSSLQLHIVLPTLDAAELLQGKNEQAFIRILPRELRCHSITSARLRLQGGPYKAKTPKKKSGKGKPQGKETEVKSLKCFMFDPLAKLQKLSLCFEEKKYFTAFRPLLDAGVFPKLTYLSIQVADGRFSIHHQTESIVDTAIGLIDVLLGKVSKKSADTKTVKTSKPEIAIIGFDSVLRDNAQALSAFGTLKTVAVKISRTEEGEFTEMFSHLKDLRSLAFQYSPTADWQVQEVCQGISNIHGLTVLELYFKNYTFSKDSVKQIYKTIHQHSPNLTKLCLGFQDVENLNDTASIMDLVLQIPNLKTLRLYLGYINTKSLIPLRSLFQLKRLIELEIGAYFRSQKPEEVFLEFIEILKNLQTLQHLCLRPVWGKEVNWYWVWKSDFSKTKEMLDRKLKTMHFDFSNHTWI